MAVAVCSSFGSQLSNEFLLRQMYVCHCSSIHFRSALCLYLSSYGEDFSLRRVKITSLQINLRSLGFLKLGWQWISYVELFYIFFCIDICCVGEHGKFILLWNSGNVLELHQIFYQHRGEKIVTDFSKLKEKKMVSRTKGNITCSNYAIANNSKMAFSFPLNDGCSTYKCENVFCFPWRTYTCPTGSVTSPGLLHEDGSWI